MLHLTNEGLQVGDKVTVRPLSPTWKKGHREGVVVRIRRKHVVVRATSRSEPVEIEAPQEDLERKHG